MEHSTTECGVTECNETIRSFLQFKSGTNEENKLGISHQQEYNTKRQGSEDNARD